jgi:hypothetical protein
LNQNKPFVVRKPEPEPEADNYTVTANQNQKPITILLRISESEPEASNYIATEHKTAYTMTREAEREFAARAIRKSMNPGEPDSAPKLISFINCKTLEKMQEKTPEKLFEATL